MEHKQGRELESLLGHLSHASTVVKGMAEHFCVNSSPYLAVLTPTTILFTLMPGLGQIFSGGRSSSHSGMVAHFSNAKAHRGQSLQVHLAVAPFPWRMAGSNNWSGQKVGIGSTLQQRIGANCDCSCIVGAAFCSTLTTWPWWRYSVATPLVIPY